MAWTDPRTWIVGEMVTANLLNTHLRDNLNSLRHVKIVTAATESVTSSTVLQDDDEFFFAMAAGDVWVVQMILRYDGVADGGSNLGGFKINKTVPAACQQFGILTYHVQGTNLTFTSESVDGVTSFTSGAGSTRTLMEDFILDNPTNAGNYQLRWAQGTSNATATRRLAGSILLAHRLKPA